MFKKKLLIVSLLVLMTGTCFADVAADLQQAADYKKGGYYAEAEQTYKSMINSYPGTDSEFKSREKLAILYIVTERGSQAQTELDKLNADFSSHADLPGAIYWIAKRYSSEGNSAKAAELFGQIIQQYPKSEFAQRAQLDIPKNNILSIIKSGTASDVQSAINSLVSQFSGNAGLAESLYDIARQCKHAGFYVQAKGCYQKIIQQYPNSTYASKCQLHVPKMDIWSSIDSGDLLAADKAINNFINDFSGNGALPAALHGFARRYEVAAKRYDKAKSFYQKIIQDYPSSKAADKAALDARKCDILLLMEGADGKTVLSAANSLISDFSGHWYLPRLVSQDIALGYYRKGMELQESNPSEGNEYFTAAIAIWNKVISQMPGPGVTAEACCFAGDSYRKLGDYSNSLACYQKVVDDYPMYRRGWHALSMVGSSYEGLKKTGQISASEADPKIQAAYEQLLEVYPDCKAVKHARGWLGR